MGPKHDKEINIRGHWPWMSSIGYYDENDEWIHLCGATLISPRHFLTAAHCINDDINWKIHIGDFNFSLPRSELRGIDVEVKKIKRHQKQKEKSPYYDLAVIETKAVELSDVIYSICLPSDSNENRDDDRVDLLGWGSSDANGKTSKLLQRVSLTLYPNSYCNKTHKQEGPLVNKIKKFLPDLFPSHLACAGIEFGMQGACRGDSGGPLQIFDTNTYRYYQVAVVHGALRDCGDPLFPGVYVRLEDPEILSFIESAIKDDSELDWSENSTVTLDEEGEWHLIVKEKMELYNWKTGEQCLMEESPPLTSISPDQSDMLGINDTAILCAEEKELLCYQFLAKSEVWMPLPTLPKANKVKLVEIPGKGVGLFHYFINNTINRGVLSVYVMEQTDGSWTQISETDAAKNYDPFCVAQMNETTTLFILSKEYKSSTRTIATFDWSTNKYSEQTITWQVLDGGDEQCAVVQDANRVPHVVIIPYIIDEIDTEMTIWNPADGRVQKLTIQMVIGNLGDGGLAGTRMIPINGGRDLLFYQSPHHLERRRRSADLYNADVIWKFNFESRNWTHIVRMLIELTFHGLRVAAIHGLKCP